MTAPEPIALDTIECVYFEAPPFMHLHGIGVDVPDKIATEYQGLPEPFLEALRGILRDTDSARCAACDGAIGFVLLENNDGFEALEWAATCLARRPSGPVMALCQVCAPGLPL
jgi:hypothetical protein